MIELLRRGHRVRTTVRDLSREAEVTRRGRQPQVDPGERLEFLAADLRDDSGWEEAVRGCDYVLHVASPFPPEQPKDPDELIVPGAGRHPAGPARGAGGGCPAGRRHLLGRRDRRQRRGRQVADRGGLDQPLRPKLTPYARSKTIAERAAWDLADEAGDRGAGSRSSTPARSSGPRSAPTAPSRSQLIERLLNGMPGTPRIGFNLVDVRDVADLQIRAMTMPEAGGERFIAVRPFAWMSDVAEILRDHLGDDASKVPTRDVPNLVVRAMGIFDPGVRSIVGQLGRRSSYSSDKARTSLGWTTRPLEETVVETARSMV